MRTECEHCAYAALPYIVNRGRSIDWDRFRGIENVVSARDVVLEASVSARGGLEAVFFS